MLKPKVTLGNYWVEAFCCCFFEHEGFEALSFPLEGFSPLESCDSVWKTGWSVSFLMRNSWDSSFGIPILTQPFNLTGQPAITLPLHWSEKGLPVGMQFVADMAREDLLIQVAAQLEEAMPWYQQYPALGDEHA